MSKRILALLILFMAAVGLFAQEEVSPANAENTIAVSFGFIGIEGSYERMLNRHISLLADISYTTLIIMEEFTVSLKGRWYPFGKAFFLDLGLGYSYGYGMINQMTNMLVAIFSLGQINSGIVRTHGFLIQPGLGWKIDIGKPDHFVLPIGMGIDFKIGPEIPEITPYFRIGLGYSF